MDIILYINRHSFLEVVIMILPLRVRIIIIISILNCINIPRVPIRGRDKLPLMIPRIDQPVMGIVATFHVNLHATVNIS